MNEHRDVTQLWSQNGACKASYEYDAFGIERNSDKEDENPFRYCGEYIDLETNTYYLRARNYDPRTSRMLSKDPLKDGLNWYTYCGNNPLMFVDPMGLEKVVLSGGAYNSNSDKDYQFEFVDTALKQIELWINDGIDPSEITWLVTNLGWSSQNITDIAAAANSYGVNLSWINDVSDITSYVNTGGKDARQKDKITDFSVFSHGLKNDGGIIALSYGYETSKNLYWGKGDLKNLHSSAFDSTETWFYACRTGYAKGDSFANAWSKITNGDTYAVYGLNGRTEYKNINGDFVSKALSGKRAAWKEQRGSYDKPGASFQLPELAFSSGWIYFGPHGFY